VAQAGSRPDTAGLLPQGVAEDVVDVHQAGLVADRAGPAGALADVARGAQQLGMGVADLVAGQAPAAELQELRLLGQGVVDQLHGRSRVGELEGRWGDRRRPVYPGVSTLTARPRLGHSEVTELTRTVGAI